MLHRFPLNVHVSSLAGDNTADEGAELPEEDTDMRWLLSVPGGPLDPLLQDTSSSASRLRPGTPPAPPLPAPPLPAPPAHAPGPASHPGSDLGRGSTPRRTARRELAPTVAQKKMLAVLNSGKWYSTTALRAAAGDPLSVRGSQSSLRRLERWGLVISQGEGTRGLWWAKSDAPKVPLCKLRQDRSRRKTED